ncbi:hypothetical protein HDF16_006367 [Granulicella aggregans]|uniref:Uncharacterized protein n=1 Tax=Granulicella aggregans TaxID=474949 RepID=A0A7W7ZLZ0_9BACT|nr:hypothetical protein [Granulicella aggregans]MBB5061631.1 hypothetical protein [Granulicella aggregans]
MTVAGVSNYGTSVLAELQSRSKITNSPAASSTSTDSISLSTDSIDFALNGEAPDIEASTANSLFYAVNQDVLYPTKNLASVGNAVDAYTNSLAGSNVYDSSYTTPSAQFLTDLANLKTAAASGNQADTESALATAKADAPDDVTTASATAIARGDTSGLAALQVEATANIRDNLKAKGYSSQDATAEAIAIEINGDTLNASFSKTYTAQTRLQQIEDLSLFAAENTGSTNSVSSTTSSPLFNIYKTLLEAKSGTATDQSLTSLDAQYAGRTANSTSTNA